MKSKKRAAAELEAELIRLNTLVRERRKQLARLETCPNKECECRTVWTKVVGRKLAGQVGKIRQQIRNRSARRPQAKPPAGRRK